MSNTHRSRRFEFLSLFVITMTAVIIGAFGIDVHVSEASNDGQTLLDYSGSTEPAPSTVHTAPRSSPSASDTDVWSRSSAELILGASIILGALGCHIMLLFMSEKQLRLPFYAAPLSRRIRQSLPRQNVADREFYLDHQ